MPSLTEKSIYIVSTIGTQGELLVSFLREQTGIPCRQARNLGDVEGELQPQRREDNIILLDCFEKRLKEQLYEVRMRNPDIVSKCLLCLFNVQHDEHAEAEAVNYGVRGVFHENDPVESIQKGISCVLRDGYWIQRRIMGKCLSMNAKGLKNNKIKQEVPGSLTRREKEVLSSLATGVTNEEIAQKLFISQHTVKTHIFNAYKKIGVSNRLQACLWAAKHL